VDPKEDSLVQIAARIFGHDIERISGKKIAVLSASSSPAKNCIIIGTLAQSGLIRQLVNEKKLQVGPLRNNWEAYQIQVVKAPFKGMDQALIIAGSDRRGAAYGVFELSKQMGGSPWYWWADVPVKEKKEIYIKPNAFLRDAPKVKYRGIFINDEAPALLDKCFTFLRTVTDKRYHTTEKKGFLSVQLRPETVSGTGNPSFVGHRQQHLQ
jgi:hypothetical protein